MEDQGEAWDREFSRLLDETVADDAQRQEMRRHRRCHLATGSRLD